MKIIITEHPEWMKEFLEYTAPYEKRIVESKIFGGMAKGNLSLKMLRAGLINFYPLIENFPKYMAVILARVPAGNGKKNLMARSWLIENINVEQTHAHWYRQWAIGFGVPRSSINGEVFPPVEMDAVNNYLWRICTYGSLAEAIAGLNYAIEGPTGKWAKKVYKNIERYNGKNGVRLNKKSLAWLKAHNQYDERHPEEALELIKAFATNKEERAKVKRAAKTGMEFYALAAESCYSMFG